MVTVAVQASEVRTEPRVAKMAEDIPGRGDREA